MTHPPWLAIDWLGGLLWSASVLEVIWHTFSAEITNAKGELCNEGEATYFLMNEEKAKEMGFLHCEVEE